MGGRAKPTFTLVIKGEKHQAEMRQRDDGKWDVLLDGCEVGLIWRPVLNRGAFLCKDLRSRAEFGGSTREQAATSMLFACYSEESARAEGVKPADEIRDEALLWHLNRDLSLVSEGDRRTLDMTVRDSRGNELGKLSLGLTDLQASIIREELTKIYDWKKRTSFFDREGGGLPPGDYELAIEGGEIKPLARGGELLVLKHRVVSGPGGSAEFEGEKYTACYRVGEELFYAKKLFEACGILEVTPSTLRELAPSLRGSHYLATIERRGPYMLSRNERPLSKRAPYR